MLICNLIDKKKTKYFKITHHHIKYHIYLLCLNVYIYFSFKTYTITYIHFINYFILYILFYNFFLFVCLFELLLLHIQYINYFNTESLFRSLVTKIKTSSSDT